MNSTLFIAINKKPPQSAQWEVPHSVCVPRWLVVSWTQAQHYLASIELLLPIGPVIPASSSSTCLPTYQKWCARKLRALSDYIIIRLGFYFYQPFKIWATPFSRVSYGYNHGTFNHLFQSSGLIWILDKLLYTIKSSHEIDIVHITGIVLNWTDIVHY